jgi:hypothetical protein
VLVLTGSIVEEFDWEKNMSKHSGEQFEQNSDYQWLLQEASWKELWFATDAAVDWLKKREQMKNLPPENRVKQPADARETNRSVFLLI